MLQAEHIEDGRHKREANQVPHHELDSSLYLAALMQGVVVTGKGITGHDYNRIQHTNREKPGTVYQKKRSSQRNDHTQGACAEIRQQNKYKIQQCIG